MVNRTTDQEVLTLVNVYVPNQESEKLVKFLLINLKKHIDRNTIIMEYFNTSLLPLSISVRENISKNA